MICSQFLVIYKNQNPPNLLCCVVTECSSNRTYDKLCWFYQDVELKICCLKKVINFPPDWGSSTYLGDFVTLQVSTLPSLIKFFHAILLIWVDYNVFTRVNDFSNNWTFSRWFRIVCTIMFRGLRKSSVGFCSGFCKRTTNVVKL